MNKLTVLGDVHQKYDELEKLNPNLHDNPVIQVGDLGFNYDYIYKNYKSDLFKVVLGNHENYYNRPLEYDLGDYGRYNHHGWEFFFVRGEWSIDIRQRQQAMMSGLCPTIWWKEEELNSEQMHLCYQEYCKVKPEVVITHTCPYKISNKVGSPGVWKYFGWDKPKISNTQLLLQEMFDFWEPKLWIFGHFHRDWFFSYGNTDFICLNELSTLDFDDEWRII